MSEDKISKIPEPQQPSYDDPVDRGPEVVASKLSPQLGSSNKFLSKGDNDIRILTVIPEKEISDIIYAKIRAKKSNTWSTIYDELLHLKVGVNGRGRRDIIRMEGVSKGGMPDLASDYEKPGWFQRNFSKRDWQKQQERDML